MSSQNKPDPYNILGVNKSSSADEIKKAYRKLAKKYHPDKNKDDPTAEQKFKEINAAYQLLKDSDARARYDRFGHQGVGNFGATDFSGFGGLDDIFESFFTGFGGRSGSRRNSRQRRQTTQTPQQGESLRYHLEISLEEAMFGAKKEIHFPNQATCPTCHGNGAKPGTQIDVCRTCKGQGEVRQAQNTPFGQFINITACPKCGGVGKTPKVRCSVCRGSGKIQQQKKVMVTIKPGISTGNQLRIPRAGRPGAYGGPPGDLYVAIQVEEHAYFTRRDDNLICEMPVTITTLTLGGTVQVPTLEKEKKISLKIPQSTQVGTMFRIRKAGIPNLRNPRQMGDMFVSITAVIPKSLSREQRQLMEKLKDILPPIKPSRTGFYDISEKKIIDA